MKLQKLSVQNINTYKVNNKSFKKNHSTNEIIQNSTNCNSIKTKINSELLKIYFSGNINYVKFTAPKIIKLSKPIITPEIINKAINKIDNKDLKSKLVDPDNINNKSPYVAAFNPGAIKDENGGVHMLVRCSRGDYKWPPAEGRSFASDFWYAHSNDGINIEEKSLYPVILPDEEFKWGYEDPRIIKMKNDNNEDIYRIVCTGFNGTNSKDGKYDGKDQNMVIRTICFETKDFKNYKKIGLIGPKGSDTEDSKLKMNLLEDKDAFFLPEKVDGKLVLFHRVVPDIQIVKTDKIEDLQNRNFWKEQLNTENLEKNTIMKHLPNTWENKLGGGPAPIKVKVNNKEYQVMIYHSSGISEKLGDKSKVYRAGVALLDINDPSKVIARCPDPLFSPDKDYEIDGPVHNVVFPQGIVKKNEDFLIYYGCADKNVSVAKINIKDLINYTKQFDANWWKENTNFDIKGNPQNKTI